MARTITERLAVYAAQVLIFFCKMGAYSPSWIWEMPFAPSGTLVSTWLGSHSSAVIDMRQLTLLMALYPMPTLALALRVQLLAEFKKDNGLKRQGLELQKEYEKSQKDMVSWKALVQPGLATVLLIYFNEAALFPVCLVVAMLFPNALEAFREAVAKEQSKTAIKAVEALNHDKTLAKLPAPPEATERLRLQEGATVKDAAVNLQRSIQDA